MIRRLLAKLLEPRSWCAGCGRPWFTDARRPCSCGQTARVLSRSVSDHVITDDRLS